MERLLQVIIVGTINHCRAVNPPHVQVLRIDRELRKGIIDEVITHGTLRHMCKKYLLTPIATKFAMTQSA